MIFTQTFSKLNFPEREALRYLGCRDGGNEELRAFVEEVRAEAERALTPAVCWTETEIVREEGTLLLSNVRTDSALLARNLEGCGRAVLFAATVGVGIDRLLARYGRTNAARASALQAVGAAYAEALCDEFCAFLGEKYKGFFLRPRFSPGYGDFSLSAQKEFFALLQPEKRIGVTLNASFFMSPSKSVTAVVGISQTPCRVGRNCADCTAEHCEFRD